jgi:hypothetical protein
MNFRSTYQQKFKRRTNGTAITETGPALFLLFIVILFPLIDPLYMGVAFAIVWYLNHLEVRELSVRVPTETVTALTNVDQLFTSTGFGSFIGLTMPRISHPLPGSATYSGTPTTVTCMTVATVDPFLTIPFFTGIPGMNEACTFQVTSTRLQEEEGINLGTVP